MLANTRWFVSFDACQPPEASSLFSLFTPFPSSFFFSFFLIDASPFFYSRFSNKIFFRFFLDLIKFFLISLSFSQEFLLDRNISFRDGDKNFDPPPPPRIYIYISISFFFFFSPSFHTRWRRMRVRHIVPWTNIRIGGGGERSEKFIVHSWNDVYIPLNRVFNTRDRICLTKGPIIDPFSSPTPFPPPLHFSRRSREPETEIRPQSRLRNRSKSR